MAKYEIEVSFEISAAHALRDYDGPCANTHGHNWLITLYAIGHQLDDAGFCLDFKILKQIGRDISERIDHQDLNRIEPFTKLNPTAENLAKWLFDQSSAMLADKLKPAPNTPSPPPISISRVRVQETSRCAVTYIADSHIN